MLLVIFALILIVSLMLSLKLTSRISGVYLALVERMFEVS
jgi:hypothetical protein